MRRQIVCFLIASVLPLPLLNAETNENSVENYIEVNEIKKIKSNKVIWNSLDDYNDDLMEME